MSEYKFREWKISAHMMHSIELYLEQGIPPGHFLSAVICNDLMKACRYADDINIRNLPAYAAYFFNEVPTNAWGAAERFESWCNKGGHVGIAKRLERQARDAEDAVRRDMNAELED